jgi:hypothetical protein
MVVERSAALLITCSRPSLPSCPRAQPAASNGPFLRLTDGSGWLFETVRGERVLDQVHVETGLWPFRVAAPPPGIALAPHPVMMPTPALLPYDVGDPASVRRLVLHIAHPTENVPPQLKLLRVGFACFRHVYQAMERRGADVSARACSVLGLGR